MGADSGVLVSDRKFGGADVLATSYTLAQAIASMGGCDLILTGKQTTDGDTAQVGAELAEFLGVPHFSNVLELEAIDDGRVRYKANLDNKLITATVPTPCVMCAEAEINTPRLPSYRRKKEFDTEELIAIFSLADFADKDDLHYGLNGSPTQVERIFPPEKNTDKKVLEGNDETLAENLFEILKEKKFI